MSDETRWARVKALFDAAVERPAPERTAFVRGHAGGDAALAAEVEAMLAADARDGPLAAAPIEALGQSALHTLDHELGKRTQTLRAGERMGPYVIRALIGQGGMGEVYRAEDVTLRRAVAIKVLPRAWLKDDERRARLEREARVLAALNHPHIAAIYGWHDDGETCAVVMELVDGGSLSKRIRRGRVPATEAMRLARQIADALDAAHGRSIVHRDLKPANVLVQPDGTVKLVDFGLARPMSGTLDAHDAITEASPVAWMGTAAYMSPEQVRGQTAGPLVDIWALGVVLYEMLTGRRAFHDDAVADIVAAILNKQPDWSALPPDTPRALSNLLRRALEKDPKRRWQSAGDVRALLDDILADHGDDPANRPAPSSTSRAIRFAALALALGVAVAAIAWTRRATEPAFEARLHIVTPPSWELASLAVSPDGQQLVYQATTDGRTRLWLRRLAVEKAEPLAGTEDGYFPFWAPDGRAVGFFVDYDLKRIDLATGLVRTLAHTPHARGASWGASGEILYASSSGPLLRLAADGGPASVATRLLDGQSNHRFPHFLPDGRRFLVAAVGASHARGIYVGSLDGPELRRVIDISTTAAFLPPDQVLFARRGALWAQRVGATLEPQGDPVLVAGEVLTHPDVAAHKAHSSGARVVAYRAAPDTRQLTWVDRLGRIVGTLGPPDTGQPGYIRLSPDGRFVSLRRTTGGNTDVWVMDVARAIRQRLTFDDAIEWAAAFSPDGKRIAYASDREYGIDDLYERPAAGVGAENLLLRSIEQKVPLDWSPDGGYLLYAVQSVRTGFDLWALPMTAGAKPIVVAQTPHEDGDSRLGAAFSPDGRWVAFQSNRSGRYEVYVQRFPQEGPSLQVSTEGGFGPQWRRDGRELFFLGPRNTLMAADVRFVADTIEAAPARTLFEVPADAEFGEYAVSPDGQRFLISRTVAPPSPITVLLNWRPR